MSNLRNNTRVRRPNGVPNAARVQRNIVSAAFRREHGFIARNVSNNPPPYKDTVKINFKRRGVLSEDSPQDIEISTLIPFAADFKLVSMTAYAINCSHLKMDVDFITTIPSSTAVESENQSTEDYAAKNGWPSVRIFPPQDDWHSTVATAATKAHVRFNYALLDGGDPTIIFDAVFQIRISLPVLEYPLAKQELKLHF
jgi:hypothetical protein